MGCCGQRRQAWREREALEAQRSSGSRQRSPSPPALPPPALQNPRVLHHMGTSSLLVKGAATGHVYLFAAGGASLSVDERDVPALWNMAVFTLGG